MILLLRVNDLSMGNVPHGFVINKPSIECNRSDVKHIVSTQLYDSPTLLIAAQSRRSFRTGGRMQLDSRHTQGCAVRALTVDFYGAMSSGAT